MESVRPSRDGHEYHEAWLTRRSLELLLPQSSLIAIAVEGLSPRDEPSAVDATLQVADAAFYHGSGVSFDDASTIEISQFKYSALHSDKEFRAADAAKTIRKFAATELDYLSKRSALEVQSKVRYSLITNQTICPALRQAILDTALAQTPLDAETQSQYDQFEVACEGLSDQRRISFATRLILDGGAGSLAAVKKANSRIIADWSPSSDLQIKARLGELRELVRNKAGTAGYPKNLIQKEDVFTALNIAEEEDLLPTPEAFPPVGEVVLRVQQAEFIENLVSAGCWAVEAEGGIGKTVFLQSVASALRATDEVVLFDCFGGGAYRSPSDARYKPERGLLHIVNELACRGLCDLLLPGAVDQTEIVRRAIKRFQQTTRTLRQTNQQSRLILILDAADNAAVEADKRRLTSFPRDILEAVADAPIDGLIIIASSRPERREQAVGKASCARFILDPFSEAEARSFISARRPEATDDQILSLYRRSDGFPRIILNLIDPSRSLSGIEEGPISLPQLIQSRLDNAIREATLKGATTKALDTFLCALSSLPPPVPLVELASGFGITESEIQGFAADLSSLLERSRHGVYFRDEPTDTLVREHYGDKAHLLKAVANRLLELQATSVYAARALPDLLFAMRKTKALHALAFDHRIPEALSSDVAKRAIRLSRIQTALRAAAESNDYDKTTDLLVELSTIAIVQERGEEFLTKNPDLVIALGDSEAQRKLFESRIGWQGARPSRLAIAYTTDGDLGDAYPYAVRSERWIHWYVEQESEDQFRALPEIDTFAAAPFYLAVKGRMGDARKEISSWRDFHAYKVSLRLYELCRTSRSLGKFGEFEALVSQLALSDDASAGLISASLSVTAYLSADLVCGLIKQLAKRLSGKTNKDDYDDEHHYRQEPIGLKHAIMRCAARAVSAGLMEEALQLLNCAKPPRYNVWLLRDHWDGEELIQNVFSIAINTLLTGTEPTVFDCLPAQYWHYVQHVDPPTTDDEQQKLFLSLIAKKTLSDAEKKAEKEPLDENQKHRAHDVLRDRILPLLTLVRVLSKVLREPSTSHRMELLESWRAAGVRARSEGFYRAETFRFTSKIYSLSALQLFSALGFEIETSKSIVELLKQSEYIQTWISTAFVREFSAYPECGESAGLLAAEAIRTIEGEDDSQLRASLFADLARAVLPANREEAAALFRRGLSELSAIGSGDYHFTNELLRFATTLRRPLKAIEAHRLAKICELNVPDDSEKFPWPLAGKAFSKAWGASYLAQISRWHDREKVDLEWTLPSALQFLVADKHVSPEDAVTLIGLTTPIESWDWQWPQFLEVLLAAKPKRLDEVIGKFFDCYEFEHPTRTRAESIEKFDQILAEVPPATNSSKFRVERMRDRLQPAVGSKSSNKTDSPLVFESSERDEERRKEEALVRDALDQANPIDRDSIEALVSKLDDIHNRFDRKVEDFAELRKRVAFQDRYKHLEAVAAASNLQLFAKIKVLAATKGEWSGSSPNIVDAIRNIGPQIARMHATTIMSREWGLGSDLRDLAELTEQPITDLGMSLLGTATPYTEIADATCLMSLACLISPSAKAQTSTGALERLLNSEAARLADKVGDGEWQNMFEPEPILDRIVASLIRFCLGSPTASLRWQAAHVVVDMAQRNRWKVIEHLFSDLLTNMPSSFNDPKMPFFFLHADLWFLFSVWRIAIDHPRKVAKYSNQLIKIAGDGSFPHAAIREVACQIVILCNTESTKAADQKLVAKARKYRISKYAVDTRFEHPDAQPYQSRPTEHPKIEPSFHFEYDFEKYEITSLARLFHVPKWDAEDRCVRWIRTRDMTIESMYEFGSRSKHSHSSNYGRGTKERFHSYGTYLGWHALALAGGELFLTHPTARYRYHTDTWDDWLKDFLPTRRDGLWLADGTDPCPIVALHDVLFSKGEELYPSQDKALLARLAGITLSEPIASGLTIEANWRSPDGASVSISSALCTSDDARDVALAVITAEESDIWLPRLRDYEDENGEDFDGNRLSPMEAWIVDRDMICHLDQYDPWGSRSALERPKIARTISSAMKLKCSDLWGRKWLFGRGRAAMTSLAWGNRTGIGDSEEWHRGTALISEPAFLRAVLKQMRRSLILLVTLDYYRSTDRYSLNEDKEGDTFRRSHLAMLVDENLQLTVITPSVAQVAAVAAIPRETRYHFQSRLSAIRALR